MAPRAAAGDLLDPYAPTSAEAALATGVSTAPAASPSVAPASVANDDALNSRKLMMIAGLVFGGGLALGIGMTVFALTSRGADTAAAASQGAVPQRGGSVALALLAADELKSSVSYVAEACDMQDSFPTERERLAESFRRCGQMEIPARDAPPAAPTAVASQAPTKRPARPIPFRKPSRAAGCLDKCHQIYQTCKTNDCGPEPTVASQFADYQRCTGTCMARYSRCRLSCR